MMVWKIKGFRWLWWLQAELQLKAWLYCKSILEASSRMQPIALLGMGILQIKRLKYEAVLD
jgi:hypothetical protein